MKLETFQSGHLRQRLQYRSFEPTLVNHEWHWEDVTLNLLLENASLALGELNAFSLIVPDIDLFIEMHIIKEAQTSSRIEGTQTEIDEVLMTEDEISPEKRNDWLEVKNYIRALNTAVSELARLPLSNRLLRKTHAILMEGVRGKHKQPGEFRVSQNWIGGSSLTDAVFIPPHPDNVPELMNDLEAFWHNENIAVPHLIRAAISHYQFETIHPFLDGNGRIGRLFIPLYLIGHGLLAKPSLYLSDFFERNRASYYDALTHVRTANDLLHWIRFFLNGITEAASKGRAVFHNILQLRNDVESRILSLGKRVPNAKAALQVFYRQPILRATDLEKKIGISPPTANALLRDLLRLGIIREHTGNQRYKQYVFGHYLELFYA
jgi:Fic family protein